MARGHISIHLMFLLISLCTRFMFMSIMISIHLMFLLIGMIPCKILERCHISIHLMFLLISFDVFTPQDVLHFNTSHVSINLIRESRMVGAHGISIHLMFLLIGNGDGKLKSWDIDFNTSHVSINRGADRRGLEG